MRYTSLAVAMVLILVLAGGCATDSGVMSKAEDAHKKLTPAIMHDPELAAYMQQVGQRVIGGAEAYRREPEHADSTNRDWMFDGSMRFHLVNSAEINAFTTGGKHVYIHAGLFQLVQSEDELAAVVAHEFAHVYGKHVRRTLNREYTLATMASAVGLAGSFYGVGDLSGGAAQAAGGLMGLRYSRGEEDEADRLGMEFHARAGWDPARFEDFFVRMLKQHGDKGWEILSSHPAMKHRAEAAGERSSKLPQTAAAQRRPPVAAPDEFKRLQQRCSQLTGSQPKK